MGRTWWEADENNGYDYLDRPVLFRKGNGHWTRRTYDPENELLTDIDTGLKSGSNVTPVVQDLSYQWDGLGNLKQRVTGVIAGSSENFTYDVLNRLTASQVVGKSARSATYAENGNISTKTDVTGASSGYTYDANKPHAVATAFNYSMTYDANGNMVSRTKSGETWSFRWTPFDKPRFISKNGVGSEFRYDANRQRAVHLKFDSMTGGQNPEPVHYTSKKLYFGNRMEADFTNLASGSAQDWQIKNIRVYIDGPDGRTGAYEFHPNQPPVDRPKPLVYHQDHLGSIDAITEYGVATATFAMDEQGNPSRFSYDPWGQRRDASDWDGAPPSVAEATPRGFTDHEMLDDLGLVHMNGRIYDGQIGRFLSADLVVQFPGNLQSYNRYSYVLNNPLVLVDPSGYQAAPPKVLEETSVTHGNVTVNFKQFETRRVPSINPIDRNGRDLRAITRIEANAVKGKPVVIDTNGGQNQEVRYPNVEVNVTSEVFVSQDVAVGSSEDALLDLEEHGEHSRDAELTAKAVADFVQGLGGPDGLTEDEFDALSRDVEDAEALVEKESASFWDVRGYHDNTIDNSGNASRNPPTDEAYAAHAERIGKVFEQVERDQTLKDAERKRINTR